MGVRGRMERAVMRVLSRGRGRDRGRGAGGERGDVGVWPQGQRAVRMGFPLQGEQTGWLRHSPPNPLVLVTRPWGLSTPTCRKGMRVTGTGLSQCS